MNYLFDENLPPSLATAIRALHRADSPDDDVVSIRDQDWEGAQDPDWINSLASSPHQWSIVTRDKMKSEAAILRHSNLTWFLLRKGWSSCQYWDLSWKMVKTWPSLVDVANDRSGTVNRVQVSGGITEIGD